MIATLSAMPYHWSERYAATEESGAPRPREIRLQVWPHRSLSAAGFVGFIIATFALSLLPLLSVLGTPALWGLLPFSMGALALVWVALRRNARDGALLEDLTLCDDRMALVRHEPHGARREWQANPYWVRITLVPHDGPVTNYVVLTGNGRTVEIGAFLAADERQRLYEGLAAAIRRIQA